MNVKPIYESIEREYITAIRSNKTNSSSTD